MAEPPIIPLDHDQRFKALIRLCFPEFLQLFFPTWAERFDFDTLTWLDKEVLPNPPEGSRHLLDLVASIQMRQPPTERAAADPATWLALTHIEIESQDSKSDLEARLPGYLVHLKNLHQKPVLPIVIYLSMSLNGIGVERIRWTISDFEYLTVNYFYVALQGLDAEAYVRGENLLGVGLSALMKMPKDRAGEFGLQALTKLQNAEITDQMRYLLSECVESNLPISAQELDRLCDTIPSVTGRRAVMLQRNKTSFDRGLEAGQEQGRLEGQRIALTELIEALLETRFGPLSADALAKLRAKSVEDLRALGLALLKANSLGELGL